MFVLASVGENLSAKPRGMLCVVEFLSFERN